MLIWFAVVVPIPSMPAVIVSSLDPAAIRVFPEESTWNLEVPAFLNKAKFPVNPIPP